ncbi:hypothetical protein [Novipirellula rosea]
MFVSFRFSIFAIRYLTFCATGIIAGTGASSKLVAQDFGIIEQRLGGIVADGELTLQQASVMLHALHEFAEHREREVRDHRRRIGVDDAMQNEAREALQDSGIRGERLERTMQVLTRLSSAMRSTDHRVGISPETRHHLKSQLDLSDDQIARVVTLANRFQHSDRHNATTESIVDWIETIWMDLRRDVESGDLSKDEAWQQWQKVKATKIASKLKHNLEAGNLSEDRVEQIKEMIEKHESRLKSNSEGHQD